VINANDFATLWVRPTLKILARFDERMDSEAAVALLMGTAAQESDLGFWMDQLGGGPGLGPYSIEPATNHSRWRHYLSRPSKRLLKDIILELVPESAIIHAKDGPLAYVYVNPAQLATNMAYSTAMARVVYWPAKDALPDPGDILEMGRYWDIYYNGNPRVGTPEEFAESFTEFLSKWSE